MWQRLTEDEIREKARAKWKALWDWRQPVLVGVLVAAFPLGLYFLGIEVQPSGQPARLDDGQISLRSALTSAAIVFALGFVGTYLHQWKPLFPRLFDPALVICNRCFDRTTEGTEVCPCGGRYEPVEDWKRVGEG